MSNTKTHNNAIKLTFYVFVLAKFKFAAQFKFALSRTIIRHFTRAADAHVCYLPRILCELLDPKYLPYSPKLIMMCWWMEVS